jgi:hypothetical protein
MGVECLCFWLLAWVCLELLRVQFVSLHLALVLSSILIVTCLLLCAELELLGLLVLATYASVFIALALLALHFGPFWLRATEGLSSAVTPRGLLFFGSFALIGGLAVLQGSTPSSPMSNAGLAVFLWQDLSLDLRVRVGSFVGVTHWLFFRLFVLETLGLNLYLFLGLVVALALLAFRYSWIDGAGFSQAVV